MVIDSNHEVQCFRFFKISDLALCIMGLTSFLIGTLALGLSNNMTLVFISGHHFKSYKNIGIDLSFLLGLLGMGTRMGDACLRSLISQVSCAYNI